MARKKSSKPSKQSESTKATNSSSSMSVVESFKDQRRQRWDSIIDFYSNLSGDALRGPVFDVDDAQEWTEAKLEAAKNAVRPRGVVTIDMEPVLDYYRGQIEANDREIRESGIDVQKTLRLYVEHRDCEVQDCQVCLQGSSDMNVIAKGLSPEILQKILGGNDVDEEDLKGDIGDVEDLDDVQTEDDEVEYDEVEGDGDDENRDEDETELEENDSPKDEEGFPQHVLKEQNRRTDFPLQSSGKKSNSVRKRRKPSMSSSENLGERRTSKRPRKSAPCDCCT